LATGLAGLGVRRGDRVPVLMGQRAESPITLPAIWRLGAVHVPRFTAFATGAIRTRLEGAKARHVVTEPSQRDELAPIDGIEIIETGPSSTASSRPARRRPPRSRSVATG
jgi:acetyl-CoA synthetase